MSEAESSARHGRLTLVNLPLEIFEGLPNPAIAMHLYAHVVALSRFGRRAFVKNSRTTTLDKSECVFFARKFCSRWGYNRAIVTRTLKGLAHLGFWTITESRDGFTVRVRPLHKVPGFAAAQVSEMNRVSANLIAGARREFLMEQARAIARADQGLSQALATELSTILTGYSSCNATEKPGSEPELKNTLNALENEIATLRENSPASAGFDLSAAHAARGASGAEECGLTAPQAAVEPLKAGEGASGAATEGEAVDSVLGSLADIWLPRYAAKRRQGVPSEPSDGDRRI